MRLPLDHELLESISEHGPISLADAGTISTVDGHEARNRFQLLSGYGLLEKDGDILSLTESGQAYLAGELDAANLEQQ
jgi:hypothetical protein